MDEPGAARHTPAMFLGWRVVAGAFGVMFVGFGAAYAFTAFFESLQDEFGATRAEISLVFSIAGALYFSLGALSGRIADRVDPRLVIGFGIAALGVGFLWAGRAESLAGLYLGYGLGVGVGLGFAYVPAIAAVQRWFVRRRGFASGIAVSGIGLGTLLVPPLAAWAIGVVGWRECWFALGALALVLGGIATLAVDGPPARRGLHPDGDAPAPGATGTIAGLGVGEAIRTRAFLLLFGSSAIATLGLFIPFVHLAPYAQDHGMAKTDAVLLFSLIGVGSTVGRFAIGGFADRLGRKRAQALMFAGLGAAMAWWGVSTAPWALAVFALAFGAFYGGFVAIAPALAADLFGARNVSSIVGVLYSGCGIGTLIGPPLAGLAFDMTGSYALPIWATAGASVVAALMIAAVEPPKLPAA